MPWLYIIIFLLISTGLLSLFGVHVTDLLTIFSKSKSVTLSDELKVVMGIPVKGFFNREYELGEMLRSMGRAEKFTAVKQLSLLLFAVGAVLALLLNNIYMVPIFGIGFSLVPVWYLRSTAATYKKTSQRRVGNVDLHHHNIVPSDRRPYQIGQGEPAFYQRAGQIHLQRLCIGGGTHQRQFGERHQLDEDEGSKPGLSRVV